MLLIKNAHIYSPEDLVKKIKYYLKHEDERELIASHGLNRTSKEHTMEKRFHFILEQMKTLKINK